MVRLEESPPRMPAADTERAISPEIEWPPCNLESNEPQLETDLHRSQIDLLIRLLQYWWRDRQDFYISGNLTVYYNTQQLKQRDFVGPDVFVVMGTEKKNRRSWAIWEEGGQYPHVVIELLSDSTAKIDKGRKKELYQNVWRLPEYFWFDPETLEFVGFHLANSHYQPIAPNAWGHLPSQQLGLALGVHGDQLRWFTARGELIPLPEEAERERAEAERERAEAERERAEAERERAESAENQAAAAQQRLRELEAYLRSQGIDPQQLPPTP